VSGKKLADLHGLDHEGLSTIGGIARERESCVAAATAALRNAFADFRSRQIEEFRAEKALICTCFGVTEESIESAIRSSGLRTVDEVSSTTNAGSGCGSCRMLIQEMLDGAD
jgi:NifU-like protein